MNFDLGSVVTIVLGILATFFATYLAVAKNKLKQLIELGKQILEVAQALENSVADNKVDAAEIASLKKELNDVKVAWKILLGKK